MKELWKRLDRDEDGFITKEDVLWFFNNLGFGKVDDESALDPLFAEFDTDNDGKLNFDGKIDIFLSCALRVPSINGGHCIRIDYLLFSEPCFGQTH